MQDFTEIICNLANANRKVFNLTEADRLSRWRKKNTNRRFTATKLKKHENINLNFINTNSNLL